MTSAIRDRLQSTFVSFNHTARVFLNKTLLSPTKWLQATKSSNVCGHSPFHIDRIHDTVNCFGFALCKLIALCTFALCSLYVALPLGCAVGMGISF